MSDQIKCAACQCTVSGDGKTIVKKSKFLDNLESKADAYDNDLPKLKEKIQQLKSKKEKKSDGSKKTTAAKTERRTRSERRTETAERSVDDDLNL